MAVAQLFAASLIVLLLAACGGESGRLTLRVVPRSASFDRPFTIRGGGLPPKQRIAVSVSGTGRGGRRLHTTLYGRSGADGTLVLRDRYVFRRMHADNGWPYVTTFTISVGGRSASAPAHRHALSTASLSTTDERPARVGFYGEWIRRRGAARHTAILMFGGSEGGLSQGFLATTIAAYGYPVLQLAYFDEPGLPLSLRRIPLEYFERALKWLARQPEVDPTRVVTFGVSRGGEASLLLASMFPRLVHAAVGYVPAAEIYPAPDDPRIPAWTYRGKPVRGAPGAGSDFYGWIRVERISGPVFVVGGDDDKLWPSGDSVRLIEHRMRAHGRHDVTALSFRGAGHEIGDAIPLQRNVSPVGYGLATTRYGTLDLGGSPDADEAARDASWPKLLRFLASVPRD